MLTTAMTNHLMMITHANMCEHVTTSRDRARRGLGTRECQPSSVGRHKLLAAAAAAAATGTNYILGPAM